MRRRFVLLSTLLALAATGGFSGCMLLDSGCPSSYELTFEERTIETVGEEVTDEPRDDAFVARLTAAGALNETGIGGERVDNGSYVRAEGSYYLLEATASATRELDGYDMRIEYDSETTPPADAEVVAVGKLPAGDRAAFEYLLPDRERATDAVSFSGGRAFAYANASAESASVFLDRESTWVRHEGDVFRVSVWGETTVTEYERRYTATRVAANESAWHAFVRDRFVRTLTLEADGERAVVRQAVDGGYESCTRTPTGDFSGVVAALSTDDDADEGGSWYVRYDGRLYRANLVHTVA